jgi:hypothetical protein
MELLNVHIVLYACVTAKGKRARRKKKEFS